MRADLEQYRAPFKYIRANGRIICLNCTAYFQSRCTTTDLKRREHSGWKQTRFCPVCGTELKEEIDPNRPEQLSLLKG